MKIYFFVLSLAVSLLFFTGCKSVAQNDDLKRQWMLVEFGKYGKEFLSSKKAYIDFSPTKAPQDQYGAFMGCNRMFFTAKMKPGSKIEISNVGSTMMYCEDGMELEKEFGKTFESMTSYDVQGHTLTLSDPSGNKMKFVAADWD